MKFLPTSGFKWVDPKGLTWINILAVVRKDVFSKLILNIWELYNDYPLAPDKTEIKREILSNYQLRIVDLYNTPIDSVKKIEPNFFDKEKRIEAEKMVTKIEKRCTN